MEGHHPSAVQGPLLAGSLLQAVASLVTDDWYKVIAEALRVLEAVVIAAAKAKADRPICILSESAHIVGLGHAQPVPQPAPAAQLARQGGEPLGAGTLPAMPCSAAALEAIA